LGQNVPLPKRTSFLFFHCHAVVGEVGERVRAQAHAPDTHGRFEFSLAAVFLGGPTLDRKAAFFLRVKNGSVSEDYPETRTFWELG
jgi:hypothetical protein